MLKSLALPRVSFAPQVHPKSHEFKGDCTDCRSNGGRETRSKLFSRMPANHAFRMHGDKDRALTSIPRNRAATRCNSCRMSDTHRAIPLRAGGHRRFGAFR